jgi:hypothetical protein
LSITQLYRDRGDAENVFDEMKNQGLGWITTKDLHRCHLTVRTVALVYSGWSSYVHSDNGSALTGSTMLATIQT